MQSSELYVSSFENTIKLAVTGSAAFIQALSSEPFWREFIPGFQATRRSDPASTLYVEEATVIQYSAKLNTIRTSIEQIRRIVVIVEASFEYLRQTDSLYTMHGSVIVLNNIAVAFIGNLSGIGKTTIAAHASMNGWKWVADEKFTLRDGRVVGGTQGVLNDTKTRRASGGALPVTITEEYTLSLLCQPILTDEKKVSRYDLSAEKATWSIYDELTRDIRQVNGVIDNALPVLQSYDTEEVSTARLAATRKLVSDVPTTFMRGPAAKILEEIETIVL